MTTQQAQIIINAVDGFSNQFSKFENSIKNISNQFKNLDKENTKDFDKLSYNLKSASKGFLQLARDIDKVTYNSTKALNEMKNGLKNGFNDITAPFNSLNNKINNALGTGLLSADDLNTNMKRISSITHLVGKDFDNLKIKAEEAANSIGSSTSGFSATMYLGAKNAVTTQQGLIDVTKYSEMMSKDLQIDPHLAMETIVNLTHAYGEGEDKFKNSSDLLVWLKEKSGSEIPDIAHGMSYAAPVAKSFALPKNDLASMYMQMSLGGVKGSSAGTAIRNFLYGTMDPKKLLDKAKTNQGLSDQLESDGVAKTFDVGKINRWDAATKMLGLNKNKIYDNKGNLQLFEYLIPQLQKAQKNLKHDDFAASLKGMFGKDGIAGITKLISLPKDKNGMTIQKAREIMQHSEDQARIQFKIYQESYRGKLDRFSSDVDNLKVKIVESGLLDYAMKFVDLLSKCIVKLTEFGKQNPWLFKTMLIFGGLVVIGFKFLALIANVAQGIFAIGSAFGMLKNAWTFLSSSKLFISVASKVKSLGNVFKSVFTRIGSFFRTIGSLALRSFGFIRLLLGGIFRIVLMGARLLLGFAISNPILAIIALLATLGYIIYKNWDTIKIFFSSTWDWLKDTFSSTLGFFSKAFDKIEHYINKTKKFFSSDSTKSLNMANDLAIESNINKKEMYEYKPFELPVPRANNASENKSIIELNIKNAPKDSILTSKSTGNNPPKVKMVNMGYQDLAYE